MWVLFAVLAVYGLWYAQVKQAKREPQEAPSGPPDQDNRPPTPAALDSEGDHMNTPKLEGAEKKDQAKNTKIVVHIEIISLTLNIMKIS